ncbi:MAG: DNA polymerase III subunit gamma/tau [Candidatus Omnitrophica bacterium]|nr:DNA polymerase III subunit gamma/tau [Candidatus Omnitrophota bacterium]
MSYIVFARKYRPQAFDEVIGQSHITTTLENAIAQSRVAHAYIFAGPRGVGKTTTARIFAKALNCERGPTADPCNKCPSCLEITQGSSLDILEIDGASNRGIDEIRNLRENVKFSPSKGRFKVYIIDEVHMLTLDAFNALLKTLEEPPAHVKFIFATTQAHKVPPTILSRCQRFDFRRISIKDIVDSLRAIAREENLKVDDDVLILVAKHSDGSMRDAQVVLDQISSFADGRISLEDASKILGAVSDDILFSLADSIKSKDAPKALKIIDDLANEGKDVAQIVVYLIEHFRDLSVAKIKKDPQDLIDASPEKIKRYEEQAGKFTVEEMLYIIYTLSNTIDFVRKSNMARVPFEVAMIKLTRMSSIISPADLVERLEKIGLGLDKNIGSAYLSKPDVDLRGLHPGVDPIGPGGLHGGPAPEPRKEAGPDKRAHHNGLDEIIGSWNAVTDRVKERKISVAMYLNEGYPESLESGTLSISFPRSSQFHKDTLETPECKNIILKAIKDVTGLDLKLKFTISENGGGKNGLSKDAPDDSDGIIKDMQSKKDSSEPIISDALEIFGGEIEGETGRGKTK